MLEKLNCYMKRLGIILITAALIAGMAGCISSPPSEIWDWYDLNAIRDNLRGNYILMNYLDSTTAGYTELASPTANEGKGWQPIGTDDDLFTGTFAGQGYEIRNLFTNRPDEMYVALFGVVGEGGVVQDIGVVNADVTGGDIVGGLVGDNEGTVSNSYSTGNVTGVTDSGGIGGLVGANLGTVSDSYSIGSVTGDTWVGGLVGWNEGGTVSNSYSTASANGNVVGVGGLVGASSGTVSNSYSTGSVTGNSNVGGLVGENTATLRNSYSTGSVSGNEDVGGLVGDNLATVGDSFWDTETSGQSTSDGGTGKTNEQMQEIETFSGAGWNIIKVALGLTDPSYIWNIVDGDTYPFLSWQS
jgi:hypothetical protein